jgi:hypothetical protein
VDLYDAIDVWRRLSGAWTKGRLYQKRQKACGVDEIFVPGEIVAIQFRAFAESGNCLYQKVIVETANGP